MPAELLYGLRDAAGHGFFVRHIEDGRDRLAAVALDLTHDLLGLRLVGAHVHDDRGAAGRERLRHRAPDVASRAGHQRDTAGEVLLAHRNPLRSIRPSYSDFASCSAAFVVASSHPP